MTPLSWCLCREEERNVVWARMTWTARRRARLLAPRPLPALWLELVRESGTSLCIHWIFDAYRRRLGRRSAQRLLLVVTSVFCVFVFLFVFCVCFAMLGQGWLTP